MKTRTLVTEYIPRPNPWTHPKTGVVHTACETGYCPRPMSIPSHPFNGRWMSCTVNVPEDPELLAKFHADMINVAKAMTEITGWEIDWFSVRDSTVNCFGDFGYFIAEEPIMANKLTRQEALSRLDQERDFQEDNGKAKGFSPTHEIGSFLLLMEEYVDRARKAYTGNSDSDHSPALDMVRKIGGLAVAAIEEHGCPKRVNQYRKEA